MLLRVCFYGGPNHVDQGRFAGPKSDAERRGLPWNNVTSSNEDFW